MASRPRPTTTTPASVGATAARAASCSRLPRDGIRAQIQLLLNYADAGSRAADLHHPPSPYCGAPIPAPPPPFDTFFAKGWAPTWSDMGHGNWATDPDYAGKVIGVYRSDGRVLVRVVTVEPVERLDDQVGGGVEVGAVHLRRIARPARASNPSACSRRARGSHGYRSIVRPIGARQEHGGRRRWSPAARSTRPRYRRRSAPIGVPAKKHIT